MKTLIQVNIEPKVGMIVEALKGRYKHHIIEFGLRFFKYDKNGKAIYSKFVHTVNEKGSTTWVEYNQFINNYRYVGIADITYKDLFNTSRLSIKKMDEIENLVKKLEEAIR